MTKIEELEQKLNECQKALAELKESKKEGKWKPENGQNYWFRCDTGEFVFSTWDNDERHIYRYTYQPLFETKKQCQKYWHFMDTVKEKSYEFSKEDFENEDSQKWFIAYDYHSKRFYPDNYLATKMFGVVNFKTYEDAQYIIDNFKDELMEYWI
jgi:hypothetical protein